MGVRRNHRRVEVATVVDGNAADSRNRIRPDAGVAIGSKAHAIEGADPIADAALGLISPAIDGADQQYPKRCPGPRDPVLGTIKVQARAPRLLAGRARLGRRLRDEHHPGRGLRVPQHLRVAKARETRIDRRRQGKFLPRSPAVATRGGFDCLPDRVCPAAWAVK